MTLTPLPESVSSVCESVPAGMRTFRSSYKPLKIIFRLKQFQDYFRFKTFQIIRSLVLKKIILGQVHSIIFRFKPFQIILGFTFNPPFHDYSLTNKNVLSALFFAWCSILNVNIGGKTFGKGKKNHFFQLFPQRKLFLRGAEACTEHFRKGWELAGISHILIVVTHPKDQATRHVCCRDRVTLLYTCIVSVICTI